MTITGPDAVMMWMAESALRAGVLAVAAGAVLAILRTRDAAARSAVWTAVLVASLLMPAALMLAPPVFLWSDAAAPLPLLFDGAATLASAGISFADGAGAQPPSPPRSAQPGFAWLRLAGVVYLGVSMLLLARLAAGLVRGWRLRQQSTLVIPEQAGAAAAAEVRQTPEVAAPVTFGWLRPVIYVPLEWRAWEPKKLEAVLLHESAHIARGDFFRQTLAAVHAAAFWFSPVAWWLSRELARLAEQASDDRVLAEMRDPVFYAEVLFSFAGRPRTAAMTTLAAVPMARAGASSSATGERIERVLDEGRVLSQAFGWAGRTVLAALTGVLLYAASAISLAQKATPAPPPPAPAAATPPDPPAPPPAAPARRGTSSGSSTSRSTRTWRYQDNDRSESIRITDSVIEYERDGKRYRITDPDLLSKARQVHDKQANLGVEQRALGEAQAALGRRQAELGRQQEQVAMPSGKLEAELDTQFEALRASARREKLTQERLAAMQARLATLQARLGELQARMSQDHQGLGAAQAELGAEQARLGEKQAQLGRRQAEIARQADEEIRSLIDQAIRDGRAKPVN